MSTFASSNTQDCTVPLDLTKHVKYTLGMVLGVDDFTQEFAYLAGRDRWLARDVLGYGTVNGLKVDVVENEKKEPQVTVSPGVALSPRGELIRVSPFQCAALNEWLSKHNSEVLGALGSPTMNSLDLYVVLTYRQCPTDDIPIPGEPCRTEEEAMAPSRWVDDFKLELCLKPPDQLEEDILRGFVRWLGEIPTTDSMIDATPLDQFIEAVQASLVVPVSSPSSPPESPPSASSPPFFDPPPASLRIPILEMCVYLRAACRVWVTDLRPKVHPGLLLKKFSCSGSGSQDSSELRGELLLARLILDLNSSYKVDAKKNVKVDQDNRPFLIHLRMLQELLLCGRNTLAPWMGPYSPDSPVSASLGAGLRVMQEPTHIVALSWPHNGVSTLDIKIDKIQYKGIMIGFGKQTVGDSGQVFVNEGSLDDNTFQVFVEDSLTQNGVSFIAPRRVLPDSILPVNPVPNPGGLLTQASSAGPLASGAAFIFSDDSYGLMRSHKLIIVVKGDFVQDETGSRAISGRFIRNELLPNGSGGVISPAAEGGVFESWVTLGTVIDINTATEKDLQLLPLIGPDLAKKIVVARTKNKFTNLESLLQVKGFKEYHLYYLRPFLTINP